MRIAGLSLMILLLPVCAAAQDSLRAANRRNTYLLPSFVRGIVQEKSGERPAVLMNYNTLSQEIIFFQDGKRLAMLGAPVDTVYMEDRKFVPVGRGTSFYEVIGYKAPIYIQHATKIQRTPSSTGYGTSGRVNNVDGFVSNGGRSSRRNMYNQFYDLNLPDDYRIVDDSRFWIKQNGKFYLISTARSLLKFFPGMQKEILHYIHQNSIDFSSKNDVISLLLFCNLLSPDKKILQ